jgi:hypothetical protein
MRQKPRRMIVDFFDPADPAPEVGNVVRHVGSNARVLGYLRVVSVRRVKVRVSRGEHARWALGMERLAERPREGVSWTMTDRPRKPKPKVDRWSPLLPP